MRTGSKRTIGVNTYQGVVSTYYLADREARGMKGIIVIALVLLSGCGSFTTLEQLEAEALITGDWSAVEQRERIIERRKQRAGIQCPPGSVAICESFAGENRCSCVGQDVFNTLMGH